MRFLGQRLGKATPQAEEEGRIQNAERPGKATQSHHKATTRPPQGHILGIDSGVQSHPKATPRLHQGSTKAPPRLHQGHPQATPKLPSCDLHATFMRPESQGGGILGLALLNAPFLFAAGGWLSRCARARKQNPGQKDPARDCCRSRLCGRLYS